MTNSSAGTAIEMAAAHPRISPIGSPQRHYRLDPPLKRSGRRNVDVAIIRGFSTFYVFAANGSGDVADWTALAVLREPEVVDYESALAAVGYRLGDRKGDPTPAGSCG
ncbi:hypothetical protein [Mycobacterium dioxanotrophicus]|uniref:hypothetical protein n=1 Tax=Mycobacterium dioxanotrophicus TaxID=482462 RepID=UPI0012FCC897|nr:hypothetical protein [Mycobacterium dioxanotrophicus]